MRRLLTILIVLSVSAVANAKSFHVTLFQQSIIGTAELQPGDYKLDLDGSKVVISNKGKSAEAEVKVETSDQKFNSTSVRYQNGDGNYRIQEIRLGGTKTKLIFNEVMAPAARSTVR
jgi:hypothetical protein